jgi:hypothetical protein
MKRDYLINKVWLIRKGLLLDIYIDEVLFRINTN